jgi:hypothetical protein
MMGDALNPIMPKGLRTKLVCLIKCDLCNIDEVLSKKEDEKHDVCKLSM